MARIRITKTLLDSWLWSFKVDGGYDDFLRTLNREKSPPTKMQLEGIRFENCLNAVLNGNGLPWDHEWYAVINEMANELDGSQQQVSLFKEIEVDGQPFLLHGVLDYLVAGKIYDCKYTKNYHLNKYFSSTTQHPMYLALVPEAMDFTYIISDGSYVYRERYPREIVPSIEPEIRHFMEYLKKHNLWETYIEKWSVEN